MFVVVVAAAAVLHASRVHTSGELASLGGGIALGKN